MLKITPIFTRKTINLSKTHRRPRERNIALRKDRKIDRSIDFSRGRAQARAYKGAPVKKFVIANDEKPKRNIRSIGELDSRLNIKLESAPACGVRVE